MGIQILPRAIKYMKDKFTPEEDRRLVALVNEYRSKQGNQIHWDRIPVGKYWRTRGSLTGRWNRYVKHQVTIKDGRYVLPSTLFNQDDFKPAKLTVRPKARTVTKSFLWGLYTITREE